MAENTDPALPSNKPIDIVSQSTNTRARSPQRNSSQLEEGASSKGQNIQGARPKQLTEEQQKLVDEKLALPKKTFSDQYPYLTKKHIRTLLKENEPLHANVANLYIHLIKTRSKENPSMPKTHVMTSAWQPPKTRACGESVPTPDSDKIDLVIAPRLDKKHWWLFVVDTTRKQIIFYSSMKTVVGFDRFKRDFQPFLKRELGIDTITDKYEERRIFSPEQSSPNDCGIFVCMYAEYTTRGAVVNFKQEDMEYFRRQMAHEILAKRLILQCNEQSSTTEVGPFSEKKI